ncbi:MAG TPA: glycosyltransferase [Ignavibacteriaceae bacterium]|nr:glycosyltransferase [Ignavibacteriaceae bacterium]
MIIISPSGNLYGSEKVLIDYLEKTNLKHLVFVPSKSILFNYLTSKDNKHKIRAYNPVNLKILYLFIAVKLLLKKSNAVYINEAGHIRYLKLLARLFKKAKFFAHVRILEDTNTERLGKLPVNLKLITVSDFMLKNLKNYYCKRVYDPYPFTSRTLPKLNGDNKIRFGVVGRITKTKGFDEIKKLILSNLFRNLNFSFNFYGSVTPEVEKEFIDLIKRLSNVKHHGFVHNKDEIYNNIELLLHFNSNESLGRIILEAIDFNKPFVCSNEGGTGEIVKLLQLEELTIDFTKDKWIDDFITLTDKIIEHYDFYVNKISNAKEKAKIIFDLNNYVKEIEDIFNQ